MMVSAELKIPSSCEDVTACSDDDVSKRLRCLIKKKYDSSVVSDTCRSDLIAEEIRVLTEDSKNEMIFDPYLCASDISDRDISCDVSGNSATKLLKCLFENVRHYHHYHHHHHHHQILHSQSNPTHTGGESQRRRLQDGDIQSDSGDEYGFSIRQDVA